jgi:hypothetical protein
MTDTLVRQDTGRSAVPLRACVWLGAAGMLISAFGQVSDTSETPFDYAQISAHLTRWWVLHAVDGLAVMLVMLGAAVATVQLVRGRGARLATAALVVGPFGAMALGASIVAQGTLGAYVADAEAIARPSGIALLDHAGAHPVPIVALSGPGALLVLLGSVLVCVALLLSRAVPRLVPLLFLGGLLGSLVVSTGLVGALLEVPSAVAVVALGELASRAERR